MAIITISRGTSTRGKELAQAVAERLGYKMITEAVLVKAAKQVHALYVTGRFSFYRETP